MKTRISVISLVLFCAVELFAQHIPPCQGDAHSISICWGYAMGRAFNRSWNDSRCPLSTLHFDEIDPTYFEWHPGSSLSGLASDDIVVFGAEHAAFVTTPSANINNIVVDQVPNEAGVEQTDVLLSTVIAAHGNPTGYYRKKALWDVTVQNSFTGGTVGMGGSVYDSPLPISNVHWETSFNIDATMDGELYGDYVRRFDSWRKGSQVISTSKATTVTVTDYDYWNTITYTAHFKKEYNIEFKNYFIGVGNYGEIKVKPPGETQYEQYTLPTSTFPVIQDEIISAQAITGQEYNSIIYTFTQWSDGNTSYSRTYTPNDHAIYTANFTGKPEHVTITSFSGPVGTYVTINWEEHANDDVDKYQVWRKVKHQGVWGDPTLLTTLNRGTTSYTDYDYVYTDGYTDDLLSYDIRAHYSVEDTYADPNWITVFGEGELYRLASNPFTGQSVPTEYIIANYPNPFNPATTIFFQLAEEAHVALVVYNIRGQRAVQLVHRNLDSGYYTFVWNGRGDSSHLLASGIYLARLVIEPLCGGETRVLTQRMLLMK